MHICEGCGNEYNREESCAVYDFLFCSAECEVDTDES